MKSLSFTLALLLAVHLGNHAFAQEQVVVEQQRTEGQLADVNGIQMYYETYGEGEPLVMLHGFGGSGANWKSFVDVFAERYKLIIPDLRGHGRSTNPPNKFTHRQAALDVYALLDELKIDKFRGMGISTGGMTLIHMATQQPKRAEAIVLIGATIYFPEQAREIMQQATVEGLTERDWEARRRVHKNGDDQIRALINQFHGFKDSYDDMNFTPPYLSSIEARTFVIHGDRDQFFPVSIPMEMYRSIPHSYLWIIPNGGHVPIYDENEETFTQKTLEFMNGDWEEKNEE
ncbi:MAG: alpha/beta fold hydrolase [Pirellulaceae bacterium]